MGKQTHIGLRVNDALLEKIERFREMDKRNSRADAARVILEKYFEEHPIGLEKSEKI